MSTVQLLFPSDISFPRLPDAAYVEEYDAALLAGIPCALINTEALVDGVMAGSTVRIRPALSKDLPVVYRGWMLSLDGYSQLAQCVSQQGASMLSDARDYQRAHHLPGWYKQCEGLTPHTECFSEDQFDLIPDFLRDVGWSACFVKDYVKSLTTRRGSVARSLLEIHEIVAKLREYRGDLEGGLCLREFEDFVPETEQRYFVLAGVPYTPAGPIPTLVGEVAKRFDSPFFSVDVVLNSAGDYRLVEIGDGQVSDLKNWPVDAFIQMLGNPTVDWR